ncbi:hypothetical protein, partial [Phormidium sp. CCY1219]|uniref:hypothetical protein n=1 Tax=Phormidium sp. CCY1219 TaxID=2886104 RepID=UPI002D1E954B
TTKLPGESQPLGEKKAKKKGRGEKKEFGAIDGKCADRGFEKERKLTEVEGDRESVLERATRQTAKMEVQFLVHECLKKRIYQIVSPKSRFFRREARMR